MLTVRFFHAVISCLFLAAALQGSGSIHENILADGEYIGREPMPNLTPEDLGSAWFHENTLVVRNDEAILDKVPIVIQKGRKGYSASDGGFMTYRVRFSSNGGNSFVALRLCKSDYLIFPANKHDQYMEINSYPVKVASGRIEINGVVYRPTKLKKDKLVPLLKLLDTEPLQKTDIVP